MAQKSIKGETNKYSGVVKSVQKTTQPEEARITPEQVHAAFTAFGFTPNERGHHDVLYWTTKPQSDGPKLIEELHKRRMEINKTEDDKKKQAEDHAKAHEKVTSQQHLDKVAMPRLSDQDINALFDEYGLPAPDPEWARNHLPNDPKKIRSILEMQRKTADDMLKKHAKNAVNSMPEVPKPQMGGGGQGAPMMGRGGPAAGPMPAGPMDMQGSMMGGDQPATPFFIGENAIVRITNPNNPNTSTLWLVDAKKKVLQPFISDKAFQNAFEDPEEAEKSIVTLSAKELGPGGALEGFTPMQADKGVNHDGQVGNIEFSPSQLQNKYGKADDPAAENKALSMLDGVMGNLGGNQPQPDPSMGQPAPEGDPSLTQAQ